MLRATSYVVQQNRLTCISKFLFRGSQRGAVSAKAFYKNRGKKVQLAGEAAFVAGSIPTWMLGFQINGGILQHQPDVPTLLNTFTSSLVISVTSVIVVCYQLFAVAIFSSFTDTIREFLSSENVIHSLTLQETDEVKTIIIRPQRGKAFSVSQENITCTLNPNFASLQLKETTANIPSTRLQLPLFKHLVKNKQNWNNFVDTLNISTELPYQGWKMLTDEALEPHHYNNIQTKTITKEGTEFQLLQSAGKFYTIPTAWKCLSISHDIVEGKLMGSCNICSRNFDLEEISLPTTLKHNRELWCKFPESNVEYTKPPITTEYVRKSLKSFKQCPNALHGTKRLEPQ